MWFFVKEPKDQTYRDLVDLASSHCSKFILVKRSEINSSCDKVLEELKPYLIGSEEKDNWPGTMLLDKTAIVNSYLINAESKELLKKYAQGLFSWVHPSLPEDLCFLKKDETPWLITIAHEYTGWIESGTVEEIEKLKLINSIELVSVENY